jgi:branched-chain amino acid transport system ATP-binding protein
MLLEVKGLQVRYGQTTALRDIDLNIREGSVVAVLGANGAGKTSLLKALIGLVPAAAGSVRWKGRPITSLPPSERVKDGLALVPEGRRILVSMSVEENLMVGAYHRRDKAAVAHDIADLYERFPNLGQRRHSLALALSGGEQQMLAIGRGLLSKPKLMMLDEPSLGLSPLVIARLFDLIRELNRGGLSILLVEQNTGMALSVAHEGHVLELGRKIIEGPPAQLLANRHLQDAYLGADEHHPLLNLKEGSK